MAKQFNIVCTGLKEGTTEDEFVISFCQKFGIAEGKARKIITSGSEVTIKKDLDETTAKKYLSVLDRCGMMARMDEIAVETKLDSGLSMVPMDGEDAAVSLESQAVTEMATDTTTVDNTAKVTCPKCGSEQVNGDECQACGIYISKYLASQQSAPTIEKSEPAHTPNHEQTDGVENPYATPSADLSDSDEIAPEQVSIGSGVQWLSRGFWHFKQNPIAWIGSIIVFIILFMVISLIPILGGLVTNLISPVVMAGFALGAHEQDEGGDFTVGHVFAGFSNNVGQLMLVGLFYLLALLGVGVVFALLMGGTVISAGMNPGMGPEQIAAQMGAGMWIMMLLMFILIILLTMAYYYAPVLIALEDMSAISAMGMSFRGCLKNWLTFIIYGLIVMVLFIVASIPVFLGLLVAIPMVQASIYVSYRDVFRHGR